nr:ribonuclease H-like domain-containing protein [Tanacetum cinerariifolium]
IVVSWSHYDRHNDNGNRRTARGSTLVCENCGLNGHNIDRSSILSRETLSDVRSAYAIISSEKSHRIATGSVSGTSRRHNDNGNRRTARGSTLVCENCGLNGHNIDRCYKIIGYPLDFGKKKARKNFKGKNVSNNVVGSSSSSGFFDEQLSI